MVGRKSSRVNADRWADWAVVALCAVALLLGWAVMTFAEGQRQAYIDAHTGVKVLYPQDWLLVSGEATLFEAEDPTSGPFRTRYEVRVVPIDASAPVTPTLASVLGDASLARAQVGTAYRVLDIKEGRSVHGQATMEASYAYVVEGGDPFVHRLPLVVEGLDVAVARGGQAYVFSLLAAEGVFEDSRPAFREFVNAAQFR